MGTELDLDDVVAGNPLAERQLKWLRAELMLIEHRCITCGVAATHPNAELTLRADYMKWDSPQAQAVRELRADRDRLKAELEALRHNAESNGAQAHPTRTPGYRADFDGDT